VQKFLDQTTVLVTEEPTYNINVTQYGGVHPKNKPWQLRMKLPTSKMARLQQQTIEGCPNIKRQGEMCRVFKCSRPPMKIIIVSNIQDL
jgi:hypothetical protein